jgi:hypothetical protein
MPGITVYLLGRAFHATRSRGQLHLAAGPFGVRQRGLAVLVLTRRSCIGELLAMTAAVGIPPVGHEYSCLLLIHESLS